MQINYTCHTQQCSDTVETFEITSYRHWRSQHISAQGKEVHYIFCCDFLSRFEVDEIFIDKIVFIDEAAISLSGNVLDIIWGSNNPHDIAEYVKDNSKFNAFWIGGISHAYCRGRRSQGCTVWTNECIHISTREWQKSYIAHFQRKRLWVGGSIMWPRCSHNLLVLRHFSFGSTSRMMRIWHLWLPLSKTFLACTSCSAYSYPRLA
jgi:hypothetical protein